MRGWTRVSSSSAVREHRVARGHWWLASLLLVATGAAVSAYLLARSFAVLGSPKPATWDLCSVLFSSSCDRALADPASWVLGIPIAGWGLVYFATLAALLLLSRFLDDAFEAEALLAANLLTLAAVVAGVALTISVLLGRHPFCPLCVVVHGIVLSLLFTLRASSARPLAVEVRLLHAAARWFVRSGTVSTQERWKILGFGCVALAAALTFQWVYVESALRRPPNSPAVSPEKVIAAYDAAARVEVPVDSDDPHLGPLDAPVRLVMFASFRCPACRPYAPMLSRLHERFGDRLLVAFKHYPLSSRCNARLTVDKQPGACGLAWAAEAAHQQGRFWPFYEALVAAEIEDDGSDIARIVRELGLDPAQFEVDRRSESTLERVAADVELGTRLQIPGTPALFLDGRPIRSADARILELLIRRELEAGGSALPAVARAP